MKGHDLQERIDAALGSAAYFRAYDLALQALKTEPGNIRLQYHAILALARTGAVRHARARLDRLLASPSWQGNASMQLQEDILAMDARLFKELALQAAGEGRRRLATEAATRYEKAAAVDDGPFSLINAATMWCFADEPGRSRSLAIKALDGALLSRDEYWTHATTAEAHLLLGDLDKARLALATAVAMTTADLAQKAVTRKQLDAICDKLDVSRSVIDVAPQEQVVHFCAQDRTIPSPSEIAGIKDGIKKLHAERGIACAFGAIRCAAELALAEAFIDLEVATEFVLPLPIARMSEVIDDPSLGLQARLQLCAEQADAYSVVSQHGVVSAALLTHSARCAEGLAMLRAEQLLLESRALSYSGKSGVVLNGGTSSDLPSPGAGPVGIAALGAYQTKAFVFCDIRGFSTIPDAQMFDFASLVMGGLAGVIADYAAEVEYKETAGDGIYIVFRRVPAAAACALGLLERMTRVSTGAFAGLGIRVSAHVGAALVAIDPVTGFRKFFGSEVIRAARIEPITPVGECYVTEPFAGILALESSGQYNCDYAGTLESAEGYGAFRMYSLRTFGRTGR
jgi:tetratricopeptide (TPR) repeat protein